MVKKVFSILLLFNCFFPELYSQWEWQNPLPQGNSLYSVQYVSENLVWSSGTTGTLLKSTDSGESWESIKLSDRMYVFDIFFINEETGWICGESEDLDSKSILRTTNSGQTWEIQYSQTQGGAFKSIVFADENYGWAAGSFTNILHTTDGGKNWFVQAQASTKFISIFLLDKLHLWITNSLSNRPMLKTTDGGVNWISDSTAMWAMDVHFLDTLTGWAAGWSYVSKTTDGGMSWEEQYYKLQEQWVDIYMLDENYGWVVSSLGLILGTTNGGENWIEQNNPAISGLESIAFKDSLNGISVGTFASLLKTTDGGGNWENKTRSIVEEYLFEIYFINENIGWITGDNGAILKTTNSGLNWVQQNTGVNDWLGSIDFINDVEGWVGGGEGALLQTTNAGDNWNIITSPTTLPIDDIDFNNYPIGWIVAGDVFNPGKLFKTTNGGTTWNTVTTISLTPGGHEIQFTSNDIGWIMSGNSSVGGLQRLYRTTNRGDNWDILLTNNSDTTFMSVYFINDSIGWISTFPSYTIFRTSDTGITWDRLQTPAFFNSIYFYDSLKGWGGASSGEVYSTTDGGMSWEAQNSPMDNPIKKLLFYGANYGWAVGFLGNIIHTSNGGVSFVDAMYNDNHLDDFILYQNYPNPFNPITKIGFEIPTSSVVTLKVYDILGKELLTLTEEYKSRGRYEIEFDGGAFASGIYFYRLVGKDYTQSKKMVLIK
jgi:photosystem II stability/assembly factor-like uncharacterized protein